jgi:hypothetical protein
MGGIGLDCTVEYIYLRGKEERRGGEVSFRVHIFIFFSLGCLRPRHSFFFLFESGELDIQNFRVPYLIAVNVVPIYVGDTRRGMKDCG